MFKQPSMALVTVAIPSYNQGQYLEESIVSILQQNINVEICIADGGSNDNSYQIIADYSEKLTWWRSEPDEGQSSAINEAVANGTAPFVCWLNSDDKLLPNALLNLVSILESHPELPAVYAKAQYIDENSTYVGEYRTGEFSRKSMSRSCIICQPTVLIRREVWEALKGLNSELDLAMDYDLWWRIIRQYGNLGFTNIYCAEVRLHSKTKTINNRDSHYREAIQVVKKYYGSIPLIWYLKWPWSVWYKTISFEMKKKFKN